jgi:excisionase family DNA binding protein
LKTPSEDGLLTVHDAAQYLAVSKSTLYGWVWQKRIPFVKVGRALRFERAELQKLIQANRFQARSYPKVLRRAHQTPVSK